MKRFLATTGISEFWNKEDELILLGPWCFLSEGNRRLLQGKMYSIFPSPWKPRSRIKEAADYCQDTYEAVSGELSDQLNIIHSVSYTRKYWQVLVGSWLSDFTQVVYDRFIRIEKALSIFPDAYTYTLPKASCKLIAADTYDLMSIRGKVTEDHYNLKLFSLIMHHTFPGKFIEREIRPPLFETKNVFRENLAKKLFYGLKNLKDSFYRSDVVLSDMHRISCMQMLGLEFKSSQNKICFKYFDGKQVDTDYNDYSEEKRSLLKLTGKSDNFANLLRQLVPVAIPMCYVEHFKEYNGKIKAGEVKAIGSAGGWYYNENFKFFAAEAAVKGSKLIDFQHGGGYGIFLSEPAETCSLEKDIFYTWGWRSGSDKKIIPLSSPYLSGLKNTYKPLKEKILFVGTSTHKYLCRFSSSITTDDMPQYFLDKKRFVDCLENRAQRALLYKPYAEIGWNEISLMKSLIPELDILSKGSLVNWTKKSKLVVIDYSGTSTIEAFVINAPTICFYDFNINLIRPEAERYFDLLRDVGILHKSPEEAARKVNEIYDDPLKWWQDAKVQKAKDVFCDRFCITNNSWRKEWIDKLSVY